MFQPKDQIGTFSYFPSINFHKAGGGFGPIRVNNRIVVTVPFDKPRAEFDLLIGDWYNRSFKVNYILLMFTIDLLKSLLSQTIIKFSFFFLRFSKLRLWFSFWNITNTYEISQQELSFIFNYW